MTKDYPKEIIFLEPFPEIMIYKIAKLLKKNGYSTVSIRILENKDSDNFYKDGFDLIISFNLSFVKLNSGNILKIFLLFIKKIKSFSTVLKQILRLSPYVIISRAGPSWPSTFARVFFPKIPLIYFPYDIRSAGCRTETIRKKRGIPKIEIRAERFCFEHADGVIHKGHPDELKFLEGELLGHNLKLTKNQLSFHPYASEECFAPLNKNKLSKKDNEIHAVHLDSSGAAGPWGGRYVYDYIRKIIRHKIHVHNYSKSNALSQEELFKSFNEHEFCESYKDVLTSKYFHRHKSLNPKEITLEASKYDYGIAPTPEKVNTENNPNWKFTIGNKLATYIEAGIPLILEKDATFTSDLVKKYKIGFLHDKETFENLSKELKRLDYKELEKNIIKARKDFSMGKNFPRLKKFIEEVVAGKLR